MPHLLDTDWTINALARRRDADTILRELIPEGIAISIITRGELYEGALGSPDPETQMHVLRMFVAPFVQLGLDDQIMERFAQVRTDLRRRGQLLPDFDLLIAATALRHGLALLTFNARHFRRIAGLDLYERPPTSTTPDTQRSP